MFNVFVYGTLRRGQGANHFMEAGEYLGRAIMRWEGTGMYDTGNGFPAVCYHGDDPVGEDTIIVGEVYRMPDAAQDILDRYEGYPHLYDRISDEPFFVEGSAARVLEEASDEICIYFMTNRQDHYKPIPNGDWVDYIQEERDEEARRAV